MASPKGFPCPEGFWQAGAPSSAVPLTGWMNWAGYSIVAVCLSAAREWWQCWPEELWEENAYACTGFSMAPRAVRIAYVAPAQFKAVTFAVTVLGRDSYLNSLTAQWNKRQIAGFSDGQRLEWCFSGQFTDGQVPRKRCLTLTRKIEMRSENWCDAAWLTGSNQRHDFGTGLWGCGDPRTLTHWWGLALENSLQFLKLVSGYHLCGLVVLLQSTCQREAGHPHQNPQHEYSWPH